MKTELGVLIAISLAFATGCSERSVKNTAPASPKPSATASPTPVPTTATPKNGDYNAKGVVTKIDLGVGSVELDHEDIPGLMPPMRMEFYVSDKKLLDGVKVGDKVDFVLRYKDHTETVVSIKKSS